MSLKLERKVAKLTKEVASLKALVESRDEEMLIKVLQEAAATYLENKVEFSMSTEGQIKELIS